MPSDMHPLVGFGLRALRTLALAGVCLPAAAHAADPVIASTPAPAAEADQERTLTENTAQDVVVTGSRAQREKAIERKRALPTIADVVASDEIGKLPDYNTAEALQRLPGVSVEIDQSEPRYVVVRGVDPNLNQVTIDGNLVGIPEAEGRRVALDTIPSDLVAAIEVVKAVTPDYDANAIGGSVNIVTPTAFDRPDAFTFATARGSYNEKSGKLGAGGAVTHGSRFGPDGQFGVVVAGSYSKRFIDSDLSEPTAYRPYTTAGVTRNGPTNFLLYDYRIMRERIGAILNLDWRPNDTTRVYVRNIYNEFTDEEGRDQFNFVLFNAATPPPVVTGPDTIRFPNGRATRQFRQNNQTQKLYNVSPGFELTAGTLGVSFNYTYAHAEERTPIRDDLEFRSPANRTATIDLSDPLPRYAEIDPRLFDPADFPLRRIRERREDIVEDLHALRLDLRLPLGPDNPSFLKAGAKYIDRLKVRDNRQTQRLAAGASTLASTGGVLPPPEDFYNGTINFGPTIDYRRVLDFYSANPALTTLDAPQTAINDAALDYRIREKIYAGYGMANLILGDLTAIGGVRVEHTEGRYGANAIRPATASITPLTFRKEYTHVLPSVHLNYRATPKVLIRAAWTNTLGRPNYDATVPTFNEDNNIGTAGNPDLEPYTSMGLDLSAEYYPGTDSIVAVGMFYKRLKNPIFTQTIQNATFAGVQLNSLSQPQNADSGKLFGVEANLQQRLTFLPAPLDGFGVSVNGTYVTSEVTVPGRETETIPFFNQSDWLVNATVFYERGPFEARVALNYRSARIVNVGNATQRTSADIYEDGRTVLDARASYRLLKGVDLFAAFSNINEAPLTFYQTTKSQTYSRQIYAFNADFGVSVRF